MGYSLLIFLGFCALIAANPRQKRDEPWDSYSAVGVSSGFGGGFAHAGFFPFAVPMPMYRPFPSPFMQPSYPFDYPFRISFPTPWYKGENVCVDTVDVDDPKEFKEFLSDVDFGSNFQFGHESEHCKGTNTLYVCRGRKNTDKGSREYITKYHCCLGFIRAPYGPGCIENPSKEVATSAPETEGAIDKLTGTPFYSYAPKVPSNPSPAGVEAVKR